MAPPEAARRLQSRFALLGGIAFGLLVACLAGAFVLIDPQAARRPTALSSTREIEVPASDFGKAAEPSPARRHSTPGASAKAGKASSAAGATASAGATAAAGATSATRHMVAEVRDPEEAKSFPAPSSVHHSAAKAPAAAGEVKVAAGAASDAEIRNELARVKQLESAASSPAKMRTVPGGDSIVGNDGAIPIPRDVPEVVQRVIAGANAIANFPYVYGGGHASFVDDAYDCSGSVSYALAAGGLLSAPETSGQLESWGAAGPGKWITIYANAGHTYMYVNVGGAWMLFDTAGRSGVFASRWQPDPVDNEGYVARHWPGY